MLAPLKRAELAQKHPWIRHVTGFHAVYGVILLATGLAHGILAGSGPAMMTGKLGWMLLLILTLLTPLKKKQSRFSGAGYILHSEQQYVYLWSCILFSRLLCNVAFATCTYRLQPHSATRTSIPLRSIRSARFLTRLADTSPSVQCVGRGFRHMCAPAPAASSNAYLDSASLHLGRGFRHMCKKEERSSGMQAFLSPFLFFPRVAQCLT